MAKDVLFACLSLLNGLQVGARTAAGLMTGTVFPQAFWHRVGAEVYRANPDPMCRPCFHRLSCRQCRILTAGQHALFVAWRI